MLVFYAIIIRFQYHPFEKYESSIFHLYGYSYPIGECFCLSQFGMPLIIMIDVRKLMFIFQCTNPILYGFMSKNFRSSFIDLLCCRYSKRHLFGVSESLRNRRNTENKTTNRTSCFGKSDYLVRTSVLSRFSQFNPGNSTAGTPRSASLSPIHNELSTLTDANDNRKLSSGSHNARHVIVELNENYRRR